MSRTVVITGLGPITGLGVGIEPTWQALLAGRSAVGAIQTFNPAGFTCRIASEVKDFKAMQVVPKSYRKAVKVMARDIELAVGAADAAARDAGLVTKGTTDSDTVTPSYDPARVGAHIGAGLIAGDLDELTAAMAKATSQGPGPRAQGQGADSDPSAPSPSSSSLGPGPSALGPLFDLHKWGSEGINHLTPLWLLKYLPNMLACHVTIIHDAQGPSNTITCAEASSGLSIGESLRVIQRGAADACFCGGAESKINPMAFLRQVMTGRYNTRDNEDPAHAVRPFDLTAAGTALGEGGGIVILEALDTFTKRQGARAYAQIVGFGASQSVHPESRNLRPDPTGRGIALAIKAALREAGVTPDAVDLIIPYGQGVPEIDRAEAAALQTVFGPRLAQVPLISPKSMAGNCGAGAGGLDVCIAAKAVASQTLPAVINCDHPLPGLHARTAPSRPATIHYALTYSSSLGGQNAALLLKKI